MNQIRNILITVTLTTLLALPATAVAEEGSTTTIPPLADKCQNLVGDQPTVPAGLLGIYGYPTPRILNDQDIDYLGKPVDCALGAAGITAPPIDPANPPKYAPEDWASRRPRYVEPKTDATTRTSFSLAALGLPAQLAPGESTGMGIGGVISDRGALNYLKVVGPASVTGSPQDDYMVNASPNTLTVFQTTSVTLRGGGGNDQLIGSKRADDTLIGGTGNDILDASFGRSRRGDDQDKLLGGPGNDQLYAADGRGDDIVNCGPGRRDVAVVDKEDKVIGCEKVIYR